MNQAEQREAYAADQVIQEAKYRAGFWVVFHDLDEDDREAATLGILRAAVERYADEIGVDLGRLIKEVEND